MSKRRVRRRPSKYVLVPSDDLESQGPGTWVKIKKNLGTRAIGVIFALQQWRDGVEKNRADQGVQMRLTMSMLDTLRDLMFGSVSEWNWITDCEGELAKPPTRLDEGFLVEFVDPLWVESGMIDYKGAEVVYPDLAGYLLYVGNYPDEYDAYTIARVREDGRQVFIKGEPERVYVPEKDFGIVGMPSPRDRRSFDKLQFDDLVWLATKIGEQSGVSKKKSMSQTASQSNGESPGG